MYAQAGVAIAHLMAGRWHDALAELEEAAASGAERSDTGTISFSRAIAAWVCLEQRDWQRALDLAAVAGELAPTVYFRGYAYAFGFNATELARTGQLEQGIAMLEHVGTEIRACGHELGWMFTAWRLALAHVEAGHSARARTLLREIHESAVRSKTAFLVGATQRVLAELALVDGDAATAAQLLHPAIDLLRAHGCENELALALGSLGCAERQLHDDDGARAHLGEAVEILDRLGTLREPERLRLELDESRSRVRR
jgi:hypothetical protein